MHHCLSKRQLGDLLANIFKSVPLSDEDLFQLVELSKSWDCELICVNYFFAQILEKKKKQGEEGLKDLVKSLYEIENHVPLYFSIQEFNNDFIDFLVHCASEPNLTLEEKLIDAQTRLSEYRYNETFHFSRV